MNEGTGSVLLERAHWEPRFTITRFEDQAAAGAFRKRLVEEALGRYGQDKTWTERVDLAMRRMRRRFLRVWPLVAAANLPNELKFELARPFAFEMTEFGGNLLLNDGIDDIMWTLICGGVVDPLDHDHAYLGVGDSDTAAAAAQTDLQAETNKLRVAMEEGYPTYGSSQKATFQSSFGGAQANYAWKEFITANASSGATALNRKVSSQGTKTAGQVWVLTEEITLS